MLSLYLAAVLSLFAVGKVGIGGAEHRSFRCSSSGRRGCVPPRAAQSIDTNANEYAPTEESFNGPERVSIQRDNAVPEKRNPFLVRKPELQQMVLTPQKPDARRVRRDIESAIEDDPKQTSSVKPSVPSRSIETSIVRVPRDGAVLSTIQTPPTVFTEKTSAHKTAADGSSTSAPLSPYPASQFLATSPTTATTQRSTGHDLSLNVSEFQTTTGVSAARGFVAPTSTNRQPTIKPTVKAPIAIPRLLAGRAPARALVGGLIGRLPAAKPTTVPSAPVRKALEYEDLSNLTCSRSMSCKDRCQTERNPGQTNDESVHCYCDPLCSIFRDCCADYNDHCVLLNITLGFTVWNLPTSEDFVAHNTYQAIWTRSSCPHNFSVDTVRSKCNWNPLAPLPADYRDNIPVSTGEGEVFENRFCAQCNGVHREDLTLYDLDESCFNGTEEERRCPDYDGRVSCSPLRWRPKNGTYRRYYLRLTTRCLTGAIVPDAMRRACQFNRNFRIVSGIDTNGVLVNYKNRFCAQCNGAKSIRCGPVRIDNKPVVRNNPRNRLLVKINPSLVQCPRGKVYDPQSKACHEAATEKASAPALRRYRIVLHISSGARLSENGAIQELRQPFKDALNYSFGIPPYHIANTLVMRSVDPGNKTIVVFELDWPLKRQQRDNVLELDAILNFTRPFYLRISNQTHVVSNSSARLLACAQYETFATHEYTVIPRDEPVVYINGSDEVFHRYQYYSAQTTRKNCQEHPVGDVSVCRLYLKDGCQGVQIPLDRGDYTVLPTGAIYRHGSHETFELEAYDSRQGTVWICTKPNREIRETENRAYLILLYVGLAVSVACLLAALVLHGLFADVRASRGVDTMNICASLLLQQSLYFVTWRVDGLMVCSIVAILIHYFTLASFNWLAVIAWRAFRSTTPQPTGQQNPSGTPKTGSVTCSVAIAWLAPVVFIIMSLVLAASGIFPCAVGFGAPEACLMPQVSPNVLLYLPIGMSLAVTVVLLAKGAFKRRKARVQAEDGVAPDVTSPLPEVTGLAVLMGATWICAFLGRVVSEKLVYPFMVLNSLHGVYLLVAFTLKPSLCGRARCCADDAQQPNVELTGVRSRRTVPSPVDTEM